MHQSITDKPFQPRKVRYVFSTGSPSRAFRWKHGRTQKETKPMNIISLIIEIISGAVGGNVAGAAMKENSLGNLGNSIAGIVGGGLGGKLFPRITGNVESGGGSLGLKSSTGKFAWGGGGGGILLAVFGLNKNQMAKK